MKQINQNTAIALAVASLVSASAIAGSDDAVKITTLNERSGHTTCNNNNFGYALNERAHVVRGRKHLVRIERNLVDVGLERASVSSCDGKCDPDFKRKGNFDSGTNNFAIDRKGFAEYELTVGETAPAGHATLVLHYFGGGRGEYPLEIVRDSAVTRVDSVGVSNPNERVTITGTNLDRLANNFSGFTRISESAATLVLAPTSRICTARTDELIFRIEAAPQFCRIKNAVQIPLSRDPACAAAGNAPPPPPQAPQPPVPPPPRSTQPATPNLLPALATPTVLTRPLSAVVTTTRGGMFPVNSFFCTGLAVNTPATVPVPKLTWGVVGVNIEAASGANARFDVQLIDVDANNRVLDTLTLPQGFPANTPLVQRDNYPGRATSIRVVMSPRFQEGSAQRTFAGCFTEPGSTQTLDSRNLLIKVDPDNRINEGNNENDNELRF